VEASEVEASEVELSDVEVSEVEKCRWRLKSWSAFVLSHWH
jgi:hypothetical protein